MKPKDPSVMNKYVKIRTCRCYIIVKLKILAIFWLHSEPHGFNIILIFFKLIIIPHLKNETKFNYG